MGPTRGIRSRPSWRSRNQKRRGGRTAAFANSSFVLNRNVEDWKIGTLPGSWSNVGKRFVCTARVWKRRLAGSGIERQPTRSNDADSDHGDRPRGA